jgi:type I restriction enzyme S subunit
MKLLLLKLEANNNNIFNNNYFLFEKNTIPENWNWYSLYDIARIGQGGTPSTTKKEYWNGKIPWVRSGEVNWNRIISSSSTISEIGLNNSAAKLLPKDTVLLAMTGEGLTRGRSAILDIECATNQSVAFIIPEKHMLLSKFLFYYFRKEYWNIREIKKGSNQPGLNTSLIKNFLIPLPSIDEQAQIILEIEKHLSVIENSEKNISSSMIQSKILRDSILKNAFEGKLVPHDPTDELAEKLLERIKRERELPIPIKKEKSKIFKKKSIDNDNKQMRLM